MDMSWLANQVIQIHDLFASLFYTLVLLLLSLGVMLSFLRMPMGQVPEVLTLVGRAVLAAFILAAFPEILNAAANITDEVCRDIGALNNFKLVVGRLGEKIHTLTWSWVSVKDSVLLIVSYISFFLLYVSVYIANAMYLFTWTLLYIFSPLLIAAFTLPSTAQATKGLFQSLLEVCLWKITWGVLAALLWSYALSEINNPNYDVDFVTAIVLNIMLAFSVVLTPLIVRGLLKGGLAGGAATMGGAILGALALTPTQMLANTKLAKDKAKEKIFGSKERHIQSQRKD